MAVETRQTTADERLDWALQTLKSTNTVELLLKAHMENGCIDGNTCPVVGALKRRLVVLKIEDAIR